LAFDKCTLLSSQGSDAPAVRPLGFPFRATSLSYSSCSACQIGAFRLEVEAGDSISRREIRCSAIRLSRHAGQLLYLIPLALLVKSAARDCFSVSGQHSSTASRSGNLHPRPKGTGLSTRASRWGVVLRLRGVRLSGLSASLWGEQVISYVGSGGWANRGRTPGVSRCLPPVIPRIRR
jgi:hypothetical protein